MLLQRSGQDQKDGFTAGNRSERRCSSFGSWAGFERSGMGDRCGLVGLQALYSGGLVKGFGRDKGLNGFGPGGGGQR